MEQLQRRMIEMKMVMINVVSNEHGDDEEGGDDERVRMRMGMMRRVVMRKVRVRMGMMRRVRMTRPYVERASLRMSISNLSRSGKRMSWSPLILDGGDEMIMVMVIVKP